MPMPPIFILEILRIIGIKQVTAQEILNQNFEEPVFAQLLVSDYYKNEDETAFERREVYEHPERFYCNFMPFASVADIYIAGHFWESRAPFIFSREDAKSPDFKIKVVGDISCDIDGPIACTIRPSTILDPIYGYDAQTENEVSCNEPNSICVIAVDNLPCELPKDASADFGREFIDKVLPHLIDDNEGVIENATICRDGHLTSKYAYLEDYIKGKFTAS